MYFWLCYSKAKYNKLHTLGILVIINSLAVFVNLPKIGTEYEVSLRDKEYPVDSKITKVGE